MAVCLYVLEPCPYKCESYVQRNMKKHHMKLCPNNASRSVPQLYDGSSYDAANDTVMMHTNILSLGNLVYLNIRVIL